MDCYVKGRFDSSGENRKLHVASFKTLENSISAMVTAGKLAGAMTAMVEEVIRGNRPSFS